VSSKPDNKTKLKDWEDQTPVQRLSNRTILRFQQLADELKNDLERILPKAGEQSVLFVSADRGEHRFDQNPNSPRRFYNALLLRTYQFTLKNDKVWQWIKDSLEDGSSGKPSARWKKNPKDWKKNRTGFEQLFKHSADLGGLNNEFTSFEDAVKKDNKEKAHDLLIDVIATLPYTGFLPGCFDRFLLGDKLVWPTRLDYPISKFKVDEKMDEGRKKVLYVNMISSCPEKITIDCDLELNNILSNGSMPELAKLLPRFIDHFVMGREAIKKPIYDDLFHISEDPLQGLFIPVYDFNDASGRGAGGFEGWLVVLMKSLEVKVEVGKKSAIEMAVQNFASRASEERMRELIERPWTDAMSPAMFTKLNYGHYGGWEGVLESETKFHSVSEIPYVFLKESENDLIPTSEDETTEITHIAIHIRASEEQGQDLWLVFRKRCDTILPKTKGYLKDYGYHIARSVNDLYQAARLRHEEIQRSKLIGLIESAHDYSKELNAIDSTFGRLNEATEEAANSIRKSLGAQPELAELTEKVEADLAKLTKIRDYSLLKPRFMMAHARTQTEGYYYEQPDWLVQRLASGTRGDIDFLIRLFVWEPLGSSRYLELVEMPPLKTEVSDWSRLFAYDEVGRHPKIDALLSGYLKHCFLRSPESGGPMPPREFGRLHPPPTLNADRQMTDVLLPGLRERTIGIRGLLPLLVFSLRASFQHAWLTTFIKAALPPSDSTTFRPVSEPVTLSEEVSKSSYSLRIEFPNPLSESIRQRMAANGLLVPPSMTDRLPWGNWQREVNFYRGLGIPWITKIASTGEAENYRISIIASR